MINFKILTPSNVELARDLFRYFHLEFEEETMTPLSDDRLQEMLSMKGFSVFVAMQGDQVVGGITAYHLLGYLYGKPELFLYDMAIKPEYRRKGIASGLFAYIKEWCSEHGFTAMFVLADKADAHAIGFYESIPKAKRMETAMFTYGINPVL